MLSLKSNAGLFLWPSVILLLGLSLTGVAWYHAATDDGEKSLAAFNRHAQDASRSIQNHIKVYFGVLHSAGSFFAGSNSVARAEWEQYVNFLNPAETYPGIEGMGFIRCIPNGQKIKFESLVRHENSKRTADYTIRPLGARETYYPVEYFSPPLAGLNLEGLDHGAYPAGLKALKRARDSGTVTVSDDLPYAKGREHDHPILFIFPIYRNGLPATTVDERQKAILGFVYARVNVKNLVRAAISSSVSDEISLKIFEGGDSNQETPNLDKAHLIYDADPSDVPHALNTTHKPHHQAIEKVGIDGTHWLFYASSRPGGVVEERDNLPWFILLAGSLLSISASAVASLSNHRKQLIQQLAYCDHLTSLPNRRLFQDRFQQALANAQRYGTGMALLFLDLDKFKHINDSLGHETGDKVLKAVADRLTSCLREGDTLSRLGGDEFVVLLFNIASEEDITSVAQKIIDIISEPIPMNGRVLQIGCSIGISIFPKDGADYDALLKNADAAMYRAKENGRNNFQFYSS